MQAGVEERTNLLFFIDATCQLSAKKFAHASENPILIGLSPHLVTIFGN
jgi:hypothetical protein